jgi:hypothetical protein
MAGPEFANHAELESKPFEDLKVYYSGSIKGVPEPDPEFPWKLVQYMAEGGADVLSEHVAARTKTEMHEIRSRRTGLKVEELLSMSQQDYWDFIRKQDCLWVDEATHVVALVNGPSHGVGMEIERAIHKPERGLNNTPILCLIRDDMFDNLTAMIKGISKEENPNFFLKTYQSLPEAQKHIFDFLTNTK